MTATATSRNTCNDAAGASNIREIKKLGRPTTASHLGEWNRETAGTVAAFKGVATQAHSSAGLDGIVNLTKRALKPGTSPTFTRFW